MTDAGIELRLASADDAGTMLGIIQASFGTRPPLDPPAAALSDTQADIAGAIRGGAGVIAALGGHDAGCLLVSYEPDDTIMIHRVSVLPQYRQHGVAAAMVRCVAESGADAGLRRITLLVRREFPNIQYWWHSHGFTPERSAELGTIMALRLPTAVVVPTANDMRDLGVELASWLRPGDLIVANGELGAGKTTLTQGLGTGLHVQGPVTSPTFVLSRIHPPSSVGAPALVHVDAYRLGSAAELDDIDLDASMADSVTLVEWGAGLAEQLASNRLDVDIRRSPNPEDDTRTVYLTGIGPRWGAVNLAELRQRFAARKATL